MLSRLLASIRHLADNTRGASTVEYVLAIGLMAAALFVSASYIDTGIADFLSKAEAGLDSSSGGHSKLKAANGQGRPATSGADFSGGPEINPDGGSEGAGGVAGAIGESVDDAGASASDDRSGRYVPEP